MVNGWARNQRVSGESTSRPLSGGAGSMRWDGWLRFSKSSCWVCRGGLGYSTIPVGIVLRVRRYVPYRGAGFSGSLWVVPPVVSPARAKRQRVGGLEVWLGVLAGDHQHHLKPRTTHQLADSTTFSDFKAASALGRTNAWGAIMCMHKPERASEHYYP